MNTRTLAHAIALSLGLGLAANSVSAGTVTAGSASMVLNIQEEGTTFGWNVNLTPYLSVDTATGNVGLDFAAVANANATDEWTLGTAANGSSTLKWHSWETLDGGSNNGSLTNPWRTTVEINRLSGNVDPVLSYGFGVKNSTGVNQTYTSITGESIVPPVNGQYSIYADLAGSITNGASTGDVTVTPVNPKIQTLELSADGGTTFVNAGVDLGNAASWTGAGSAIVGPISATTSGTGNFNYWQLVTKFTLTPNRDAAAFSGYAEITAVPVPAAVWLMGSGVVSLLGLARRRQA